MHMQSRIWKLEDVGRHEFAANGLAVLGHPIAHSLSPQMHNAALLAMRQTQLVYSDWEYYKFDVLPQDLPEALERLWEQNFVGINLTLPHKVEVLPYLSKVEPLAKTMGAVNTLKRLDGGGYMGYNTDGYGFVKAVEEALDFTFRGGPVILLGAGGAARAAARQCLEEGVRELWIGNRNQERLADLIDLLKPHAGEANLHGFDITHPPDGLPEFSLWVNATSLGLKAEDGMPIDLEKIPQNTKIYDMTYGVENALAQAANVRGIKYAGGLSMLVWQAVRALEIWTGGAVSKETMLSAAKYSLSH